MSLRISGKKLDIGDALRGHIDARIADAVGKYFDGGFSGHVTLERDGPGFRAETALHLDTGVTLEAEGRAQDAHQSFDRAAERIEKRLRRYKRRLKEHHGGRRGGDETVPATSYVIAAPDEDAEMPADYTPVVIAEEATALDSMTVSNAVMAMDLGGLPVVVFRNAGSGSLNVVYRRADGNIGWVDPAFTAKRDSAPR